jgi:hypothetical protein
MLFRNGEFTIFENQGLTKLQIHEHANFGGLVKDKTWSHEHAGARNLKLAEARTLKGG